MFGMNIKVTIFVFHFNYDGSSLDLSPITLLHVRDQDDKGIESPSSNHPRKALGPTPHQYTVGSYPRRTKPVGARSWPLSPPSSSETHNALCYTSIPHTPSRRKRQNTSQAREAWFSWWKEELLWNLIWPSEGKFVPVCWRLELHTYSETLCAGQPRPSDIQRTVLYTASLSKLRGCLYNT